MKYIVQYVIAVFLLLFSTLAAWYEGSAIRDNPWEWKYSTFFSEGVVKTKADISQLDHFVYAAKFSPFFPILMVISLSYLLILSCYLIFRKSTKALCVSFLSLGIGHTLFTIVLADSPTTGGKSLTVILLSIGILLFLLAGGVFLRMMRSGSVGIKEST
ncbi:DUF4306 domain-containing protein [Gracilibacillus oryzae]|uniref:DUF4306 domain-containing protein n=1 Tax=Gracilibacillus oryzae TaxID=1672701 RepID=A0A7C8GQE7_9BACI|nr:YjdJ family protein [Gracilibacillus oryzae]KAB8126022.1 DUF4306 domain-containing protein [Gracilibacillus oryzae]